MTRAESCFEQLAGFAVLASHRAETHGSTGIYMHLDVSWLVLWIPCSQSLSSVVRHSGYLVSLLKMERLGIRYVLCLGFY